MASLRTFKLGNFARRPAPERVLLVQALFLLAALRTVTLLLCHKRQTRLFGQGIDLAAAEVRAQSVVLDDQQVQTVHQVRRAVARGAVILRLRDSCLIEALVARQLLYRFGIPSIMYLGVEEGAPLKMARSHVWVDAGTIPVAGYPRMRGLQPCAAFPFPW